MTPRQRANELAPKIKTHYHLSDCVPIWSNSEAQKHGGKLNKQQMAFVLTYGMENGDDLTVICPFSRKLLPTLEEADVMALAGQALIGRIKLEMINERYPNTGTS